MEWTQPESLAHAKDHLDVFDQVLMLKGGAHGVKAHLYCSLVLGQ